jgi:hypothetical protein
MRQTEGQAERRQEADQTPYPLVYPDVCASSGYPHLWYDARDAGGGLSSASAIS